MNTSLLKKISIKLLIFLILLIFLSGSHILFSDIAGDTCNENFYSINNISKKNDVEYQFLQIPILPQIENLACHNLVSSLNYESKSNELIVTFTYSKIYFIIQFLLLNLVLIYFKRYFNFNFYIILIIFDFFFFIQFYGLPPLSVLLKIINFNVVITVFYFFYLIYKDFLKSSPIKDFNIFEYRDYLKIFLVNIYIFIVLKHIDNFYFEEYFLHLSTWNINYSSGFNRRGLIGEIFSYFNFLDIRFLTLFVISNIFGLLFKNIYKICVSSQQTVNSLFVLTSPFYILFVLNDFSGGNFKEIIGYLSFTYLVLFNNFKAKRYLYLCVLLYVLALFSHSVNIFLFTFFLFYIYRYCNLELKKFLASLFLIPSIFLVIFYFSFNSDLNVFNTNDWCIDLQNSFNLDSSCENLSSTYMLEFKNNASFLENIRFTSTFINLNIVIGYIILWIVGFFYILDTPYFHKFYKDFLVLIILHTPLFLIAIDWGRWIHMFLFCLYTVYLSEEKEKAVYLSSLDFVKFVFFNTALYLPHFTKKFDINMIFNNQNDTFRVIEVFTNLYKFG